MGSPSGSPSVIVGGTGGTGGTEGLLSGRWVIWAETSNFESFNIYDEGNSLA